MKISWKALLRWLGLTVAEKAIEKGAEVLTKQGRSKS